MVKLDVEVLRYLTKEDFRVLTAVEMGQKNHEIVPTALIAKIAGLKTGGAFKIIHALHRNKLLYHDGKKYDGYKLTYLGYDYLAIKALAQRGHIVGVGRKIGVGKESDVYECVNESGEHLVLKIHRLGRISFRSIKEKRDYLGKRQNASWLYMSRLAALREFAYMKALYDHGFPTPTPIDSNRHCVLMSLVDATPFGQVMELKNPEKVYSHLMNMIVRLAEHGLIHCDFNEFNLMLDRKEKITLIDFPQMVSTSHPNARELFERDVQCIRTHFAKRFHYESDEWPNFFTDTSRQIDLDVQLKASGVTAEQLEEFDKLMRSRENEEEEAGSGAEENEDSEDDEEEEEQEEDATEEKEDPEDEDEQEIEEEEEEEEEQASDKKKKKATPAPTAPTQPPVGTDSPQPAAGPAPLADGAAAPTGAGAGAGTAVADSDEPLVSETAARLAQIDVGRVRARVKKDMGRKGGKVKLRNSVKGRGRSKARAEIAGYADLN